VQSASIRTPLLFANPVAAVRNFAASCRPDFERSQARRSPAHHNRKCLSYFRSIDEGTRHRSRASASVQSSSEADLSLENNATKSKAELGHKSRAVVYDLSATIYCILNRGLPRTTVYDLRFKYSATTRSSRVRGEISPRIKCNSLRFECNRLLYLNRGLPGSAVYDLSTDRQPPR
jgi:hypothetical protein